MKIPYIVSFLGILFLIGAGCTPMASAPTEEGTSLPEETQDAAGSETSMLADDGMESLEHGRYTDYDTSLLDNAREGDVVLFFHANWCPTCRVLDTNLNESRDDIPVGLTILKVNYDSETELKKKYGVTVQHTLVQVDADGMMLQKKLGGNRLEDITSWVE